MNLTIKKRLYGSFAIILIPLIKSIQKEYLKLERKIDTINIFVDFIEYTPALAFHVIELVVFIDKIGKGDSKLSLIKY